ncbi:MAG: L-lysine 2,3-aminomutase [Candidatus Parcubacteria bacterium]|jgi:lysine 2,3-aminomutase
MNKLDFIFSITDLIDYLRKKGIDTSQAGVSLPTGPKSSFFLLIPRYYVDLIDWYDPADPLRKMVLTSNLEQEVKEYEMTDPIGDHSHSPVPGIIHRYPDRCLLNLINICAVHCRFCFRRNLLDKNNADYEESMKYIETHTEIWEVILSGGDPFMLTAFFLDKVIERLRRIPHVKNIRFHTRTPAVYPQRLTDSFIESISRAKPVTVVLHVNHPREVTAMFVEKINKLHNAGVMLLSQTVLMKDVNDAAPVLEELFKKLVTAGIKPYYLHHPDLAAGTDHFRVSVEQGKDIIRTLRGSISGVCMPEYVIDTPGGNGKIPVFWFKKTGIKTYTATNFEGKTIEYTDHYTE